MGQSYMQMIYIDKQRNARHTGVGAAMETSAKTWKNFLSWKKLGLPDSQKADFLLDYHDSNGDLIDTIALNRDGFEAISGEKAKADWYYVRYDNEYWRKAREERNAA